jgi:hypothetical protein
VLDSVAFPERVAETVLEAPGRSTWGGSLRSSSLPPVAPAVLTSPAVAELRENEVVRKARSAFRYAERRFASLVALSRINGRFAPVNARPLPVPPEPVPSVFFVSLNTARRSRPARSARRRSVPVTYSITHVRGNPKHGPGLRRVLPVRGSTPHPKANTDGIASPPNRHEPPRSGRKRGDRRKRRA